MARMHHKAKATEHMQQAHMHVAKAMHHHEMAAHDGGHTQPAKGEMATVKRVAGSSRNVGAEEAGGCQYGKGLSGADPN